MKPISEDLRRRIIDRIQENEESQPDIAEQPTDLHECRIEVLQRGVLFYEINRRINLIFRPFIRGRGNRRHSSASQATSINNGF